MREIVSFPGSWKEGGLSQDLHFEKTLETSFHHLRNYFRRYTQDVEESLNFWEWLHAQNLELDEPEIEWKGEIFRIVFGGYNPLSVAGSLARGGRFNVGGAQLNHFFPNISMQACLYGAASIECARKEAGEFLDNAEEYAIKPKKKLQLWDLSELISTKFIYPDLKKHVDSSPLAARWELQKVPKVSQILGFFLRKKGGDGLIYPSTKDANGKILALFAKDDAHSKRLFDAERRNPTV